MIVGSFSPKNHLMTDWNEILWQPIRSFYPVVFEANTCNKTEHSMWERMKNRPRKLSFLVYHFFKGQMGVLKDVTMVWIGYELVIGIVLSSWPEPLQTTFRHLRIEVLMIDWWNFSVVVSGVNGVNGVNGVVGGYLPMGGMDQTANGGVSGGVQYLNQPEWT